MKAPARRDDAETRELTKLIDKNKVSGVCISNMGKAAESKERRTYRKREELTLVKATYLCQDVKVFNLVKGGCP